MRKAKIICTLGPAVDCESGIKDLIENGMNCARLNFSHGTYEEQKRRIDLVKKFRVQLNHNVSIMLDTKGPEIRIKKFLDGCIELNTDDLFTLSSKDLPGCKEHVSLTYKDLAKYICLGTQILIDDGKILLEVVEILDGDIKCKVINGGIVTNNKSINIPNVTIPMPYISEVDKQDLLFGISQDVDFVAASFVRTEQDVLALRKFLHDNGGENILIIAKIENRSGVDNIENIIDASDGIMVARGDMGVEIPFIMLPTIQKNIIKLTYMKGKHIITATQMLESMTTNAIPTRAEVTDVANAIYDGSTVVMLSGETAAGKNPIAAVKTMSEIIKYAEESKYLFTNNSFSFDANIPNAISQAACNAAHSLNAKAIIVITRSGKTASLIANYRPNCPIIAAVVDKKRARHLSLTRGVTAVTILEQNSSDSLFEYALNTAMNTRIIAEGDTIVIVAGSSTTKKAPSDMLKIITI